MVSTWFYVFLYDTFSASPSSLPCGACSSPNFPVSLLDGIRLWDRWTCLVSAHVGTTGAASLGSQYSEASSCTRRGVGR